MPTRSEKGYLLGLHAMFASKGSRSSLSVRDVRRGATRWLAPLLVGLGAGSIGGRLAPTVGVVEDPACAPWPSRLLAWVLLVFLMPLFAFPLIPPARRSRCSAPAVGLILGLTGFAGLAAHDLLGSGSEPAPKAMLLVLGIAISLVYNWCILWQLDDERG